MWVLSGSSRTTLMEAELQCLPWKHGNDHRSPGILIGLMARTGFPEAQGLPDVVRWCVGSHHSEKCSRQVWAQVLWKALGSLAEAEMDFWSVDMREDWGASSVGLLGPICTLKTLTTGEKIHFKIISLMCLVCPFLSEICSFAHSKARKNAFKKVCYVNQLSKAILSSKMSFLNEADGVCGKQQAECGRCMTACTRVCVIFITNLFSVWAGLLLCYWCILSFTGFFLCSNTCHCSSKVREHHSSLLSVQLICNLM